MGKVFSVAQVNAYVRGLFDDDLILSEIKIKGELSNVKYHSSGHIYFTLKDSKAAISAMMFEREALALDFTLKEGQLVVVTGRVSVYERDGRYQIYARSITREGAGLLYEKYEKLKKELSEMGMFDGMYKKPIPPFVQKLGVVTAPTGAAVRDIINIAKRRNPYLDILLYPAKVQGDGAAESIVTGIETLDKRDCDVIIIGRGGGSIEDLWAFNEEIVARAIFNAETPIISGTGHETDTTIADWVADLRAPTPSAAAELAVFDYRAFENSISDFSDSLTEKINQKISGYKAYLREMEQKLNRFSPVNAIGFQKEKLNNYENRLNNAINRRLENDKQRIADIEDLIGRSIDLKLNGYKQRLSNISALLEGVSPARTLSRGYSFVENAKGKPLKSVKDVRKGSHIQVYLRDGKVYADVSKTEKRDDY